MRAMILLAALAVSTMPVAASALPAKITAAVAAKTRPAEMVARDAARKPAEVLAFLDLQQGDAVLDFFAGGGYYSELIGRAVGPKGSVIAFEPAGFYRTEKQKADWAALVARTPNVRVMPLPIQSFDAAPNSFDRALLHLVYHDLYWESAQYNIPRMDPDAILAKLYRSIKPGGTIVVIDHAGPTGDTRAIVEKTHRIDPETVKADFIRAGFVLDSESDMLRTPGDDMTKSVFDPEVRGKTDRFVLRFKRPG